MAGNTSNAVSFSGIYQDTVTPTLTAAITNPGTSPVATPAGSNAWQTDWYNVASHAATITYGVTDADATFAGVTTPDAYTFSDGTDPLLAHDHGHRRGREHLQRGQLQRHLPGHGGPNVGSDNGDLCGGYVDRPIGDGDAGRDRQSVGRGLDPVQSGRRSVDAVHAPFIVSAQGYNTVQYRSTDAAGNVEGVNNLAIDIDLTKPVTTATTGSYVPGTWTNQPVTVTLAATDNLSGVALTQYNVDGGAWTTYTIGTPFTVSAEGANTVEYRSTDVARNVESAHSLSIEIAPTVALTGNSSTPAASAYTLTLGSVVAPTGNEPIFYVIHWGDTSPYSDANTNLYVSATATPTGNGSGARSQRPDGHAVQPAVHACVR